jgi:hypothetical protein
MAPVLLRIVDEAEDSVAGDGITVSSIVVAVELALVHVTTHVSHHAGHPVSNLYLSTDNGIAVMIGKAGFVAHRARVVPMANVQTVERLVIDTDLGLAEREITSTRIQGPDGILLATPPESEDQSGNCDGGH